MEGFNHDSKPAKTSQPLGEDIFWSIIEESLQQAEDQGEQEQFLIDRIKKLTPTEIVGFRLYTDKLLYESYTSEMWCAGYIINGGLSDDGFEYFRLWVISKGKEVFYKAKENPDSLADYLDDEEEFEFESFWYVALGAFEETTGKDLYDFIDNEAFPYGEGNYPPITFNWKEEDPASMQTLCPRLFKLKWEES